jgi:hypothetical protein
LHYSLLVLDRLYFTVACDTNGRFVRFATWPAGHFARIDDDDYDYGGWCAYVTDVG